MAKCSSSNRPQPLSNKPRRRRGILTTNGRSQQLSTDAKGAKWGWGILGQTGRPNHAVFLLKEGTTFESGQTYRIILEQNLDNPKHTIGRLRIAVTTAIKPSAIPGVDETTWTALAKEASQRNDNERKAIANFYRSTAPRLEPIRKELAEKEAERKKYEASIPSMLATKSSLLAWCASWLEETGWMNRANRQASVS